MKLNLRFLVTLILIVAIVISFVLIVLEVMSLNNKKDFVFTVLNSDTKLEKLKVNDAAAVKEVGTATNTLLSDTQYYRYGSLAMHILAVLSGVYVVYSG